MFACMRICMDSEVNSLRTNICNDFYPPRSPPHDLLSLSEVKFT